MIVGTTPHPLINPEPITPKGIHSYNPRLFRIYTDRTGKEYAFTPTEKKTDGTALGTIYQKRHQVGSDKKWMGKVGNPRAIPNDPDSTRTRSRRGINVDTIFEKLAFDLFQELGRGYFEVPKTHLANLPLFNKFTSDHHLALGYREELGMNRSLRIMSFYISGYQDLIHATTLDSGETIGLMDFIEHYHRPPESILTPEGILVPLSGMMALLAVGRLLADADLLGGAGLNAGFKWIYNEKGHIVSARVVKIDPGFAFHFTRDPENPQAGCENWVVNTRYGLGSAKCHLEDLKDLQTSTGNFTTRIEFEKLTPAQKDQFLGVLLNTARYLKSAQVLDLLFFREGRFHYSKEAHLPQEFAEQTKQEMVDWINWQLEIYQEPLQEFKQRHPEQLLKIRYIDAFGELALPMSDKTYPIRELFSDLALVIPEEEQKQQDMEIRLKAQTRRIRLTELFDDTTRTVLITGEPGTGKSTLCQKIAHDWASGRLFADKFSAVIWIPLRHFNGRDLRQPLHEAIATYVAEVILNAPNLRPFVLATMQQKPVLYVLDGFDEAVDSVRKFFIPLLEDQHVLMTARPETQNLPTTWDRKIENRGFSLEQVKVYIEQFFEGSQALLRKIQNQPFLQSLAKNPFHLQMLCHLTKENISVDSLTELYATMINQILKWEAKRLGKEPNRRLLLLLGKALNLAKEKCKNLSDTHLDQVLSEGYTKEQLLETGLIKKSVIDSVYDVVHASMGEYLIANWLSESPQEMQTFLNWFTLIDQFIELMQKGQRIFSKKEVPQVYKNDLTEKDENILSFLCGIEYRKGRALHFFQNLYVAKIRLFTVLACVNECTGLREEIPSIKLPLESNLNEAIEHILKNGWLETLRWINHIYPKCVMHFERKRFQGTALHVAAGSGCIAVMQWLCDQDPSFLKKADMHGRTPLHYAAWNGQLEAMQWLCDQDPPMLHRANKDGWTPLYAAAWDNQVEAMQWLYKKDPSLLQKADMRGWTLLHVAAGRGHVEAMEWIYDQDPLLLQMTAKDGETALYIAALAGQVKAMEWLYKQDHSLLQKADNVGRTPLHIAAISDQIVAMQWLCDQDLRLLQTTDMLGQTSFHTAALKGNVRAMRWLWKKDPSLLQKTDMLGQTSLHIAALRGNVRAMQWPWKKDPSLLQKVDEGGRTPLHLAASMGQIEAMQLLYNQDPLLLQKADKLGKTPLHAAAQNGRVEAMKWLWEKDHSLLQKANNHGSTPLHFAAQNGRVEAMQWLCDQDPSLLQKADKHGSTPLHAAANYGRVEAMEWLCKQDPSLLQKTDKRGETPLHHAAKHHKAEAMQWLREQVAVQNEHVEALQWLREHGCTEEKHLPSNRCAVS